MKWIPVAAEADLTARQVITVRGADRRIAVFWNDGEPRAVDNRCPHMGFPLDRGTLQEGILTCHWHHARFALKGGCAFDLFADDIPTFAVRVAGGQVEVADSPETSPTTDDFFARLRRGLEQNLNLIQAKSLLGLRRRGTATREILRALAAFGSENHDAWTDGMTLITLIGRLDDVISEQTRLYGLSWAARRIAQNCANQPHRRERGPLFNAHEPLARLQEWFRDFVVMRQRDGAERALLTAAAHATPAELQRLLGNAILQRIYIDSGHLYDFANKALELGQMLASESASAPELWPSLLPLLVEEAVSGRGEEDAGVWRRPIDLISALRQIEPTLADLTPGTAELELDLRSRLLGDDPHAILDTLVGQLRRGVNPEAMAREIALAAAWRLARFSPGNELGDWFDPAHTFIYAQAVLQSFQRTPSTELLPALLHGAIAVFQDRFLNVPPAGYPETSPTVKPAPEQLEAMLATLDHVPNPKAVVQQVVQWVRNHGDLALLTDRLAWAVIREDLDFHKLQVLEAAYQLSQTERCGLEDQALVFAAAARHLAAHCPTARTGLQGMRTAIKLHRGKL